MLHTRVLGATCVGPLRNNAPRVCPPLYFGCKQDEKALQFISTVPRKWRLFWTIESIGISFSLALVAILYTGDGSSLLKANTDIIESFPTWFIWGLNPAAVTLSSVIFSSALQVVCESISDFCDDADDEPCCSMLSKGLEALNTAAKTLNRRFSMEPLFFVSMGLWCAHGVANWRSLTSDDGFPVALSLVPTSRSSQQYTLEITENKLVLICLNAILAAGFAAKTLGVIWGKQRRVTVISQPPDVSDYTCQGQILQSCADSIYFPCAVVTDWVGYWVLGDLAVVRVG